MEGAGLCWGTVKENSIINRMQEASKISITLSGQPEQVSRTLSTVRQSYERRFSSALKLIFAALLSEEKAKNVGGMGRIFLGKLVILHTTESLVTLIFGSSFLLTGLQVCIALFSLHSICPMHKITCAGYFSPVTYSKEAWSQESDSFTVPWTGRMATYGALLCWEDCSTASSWVAANQTPQLRMAGEASQWWGELGAVGPVLFAEIPLFYTHPSPSCSEYNQLPLLKLSSSLTIDLPFTWLTDSTTI